MSGFRSLRATHFSGSVVATPVKEQTKKGRGFRVKIINSGAQPLEISFNGGTTFYPIAAGSEFSEDVAFHFFYLRSNATGTTYTGLIFEG